MAGTPKVSSIKEGAPIKLSAAPNRWAVRARGPTLTQGGCGALTRARLASKERACTAILAAWPALASRARARPSRTTRTPEKQGEFPDDAGRARGAAIRTSRTPEKDRGRSFASSPHTRRRAHAREDSHGRAAQSFLYKNGACRKVCERAGKRADWLGLQAGLPLYGRRERQPRPAHPTAIFKLCDRPAVSTC